jgi:hypothetical protein
VPKRLDGFFVGLILLIVGLSSFIITLRLLINFGENGGVGLVLGVTMGICFSIFITVLSVAFLTGKRF